VDLLLRAARIALAGLLLSRLSLLGTDNLVLSCTKLQQSLVRLLFRGERRFERIWRGNGIECVKP